KVRYLDCENRIEKHEVDFGRILKENEANKVEHDQLKVDKEVIQISSDEAVFTNEDLDLFNDVKYQLTDVEIMMNKKRPKRSRAPIR
nr:hypothetical protein [Tanacetum cinerariifolium]